MVVSTSDLSSEELDSLEILANSIDFKLILESSSEHRYVPRTLFISHGILGILYVGPGDDYELNCKVIDLSNIEGLVKEPGKDYIHLTLTSHPGFCIYKNKKDFLREVDPETHYHREISSDDFLSLITY